MNVTSLFGKLIGTSKTYGVRTESALAAAGVGVWELHLPAGSLSGADGYLARLGVPAPQPATDADWVRLLTPASAAGLGQARARVLEKGEQSYEALCVLDAERAGATRHILERGSVAARDAGGLPLRLAGVWIDLSARTAIELRRDWCFAACEETEDLLAIIDLQGRLLYLNRALRERCHPDLPADPANILFADLYAETSARRMLQEAFAAALERGSWRGEALMRAATGGTFEASQVLRFHKGANGEPDCLSLHARDLSAVRAAEAVRERHAQRAFTSRKLESLGLLAGGLAHEFNNLLTAVLGNASLARSDLRSDPVAQSYFRQIEEVSFRAAEHCQVLHSFAGKGQIRAQPVDLNPLIDDWLLEHRDWIGGRARVAFAPASSQCIVKLDTHQFSVCLRQLLDNAIEASTAPEPLVVLRTGSGRDTGAAAFPVCLPADPPPGDLHWVEVADQGSGMNASVLERSCEPFFTSRQGHAGLGLTTVLGIVRSHGGVLFLSSDPGRGTTVRIAFPGATGAAVAAAPAPAAAPGLWRGAGQVLLVDDQATVRNIATRLLENLGFTPLVAADGAEGVKVFRQHAASLTCVLLDMSMPGMDGDATYREFRRINAEVPVILMSGFTEAEMRDNSRDLDFAGFLQKPFSLESLSAKLSQVLA